MTASAPQELAQAADVAPRPIALARSYSDVHRAIADHCERIAMTRAELDAEAGIADGNAAKALARRARKRLGWVTLGRVLAAAGLVLIVAIDPDAPVRDVVASQSASRVRYSRAKHWRNVKGSAWGRRMAALRALKLSPERRREIARKGGQARHQRRSQQSPSSPRSK
jgi:Stress-induced bacterial acidophilic repeat motif